MDKLWAPWRSKYLYLRKAKKCIFCGGAGKKRLQKHVISVTKYSFAMLNLYPYNNGHVMVSPHRHVASLEYLTTAELDDLMRLLLKVKKRIDNRLKPHGYNIGLNIGKVSGAGFDGHVHIHIVPRWDGDTNFMPITADTKVVSESLSAMERLLKF